MVLLKDVFNAPNREEAVFKKNRLMVQLEQLHGTIADWLDEHIESCFS